MKITATFAIGLTDKTWFEHVQDVYLPDDFFEHCHREDSSVNVWLISALVRSQWYNEYMQKEQVSFVTVLHWSEDQD
jgi:hypothetical protein